MLPYSPAANKPLCSRLPPVQDLPGALTDAQVCGCAQPAWHCLGIARRCALQLVARAGGARQPSHWSQPCCQPLTSVACLAARSLWRSAGGGGAGPDFHQEPRLVHLQDLGCELLCHCLTVLRVADKGTHRMQQLLHCSPDAAAFALHPGPPALCRCVLMTSLMAPALPAPICLCSHQGRGAVRGALCCAALAAPACCTADACGCTCHSRELATGCSPLQMLVAIRLCRAWTG